MYYTKHLTSVYDIYAPALLILVEINLYRCNLGVPNNIKITNNHSSEIVSKY